MEVRIDIFSANFKQYLETTAWILSVVVPEFQSKNISLNTLIKEKLDYFPKTEKIVSTDKYWQKYRQVHCIIEIDDFSECHLLKYTKNKSSKANNIGKNASMFRKYVGKRNS